MDLDLKRKVVIVTGGTKGIGVSLVRSFMREGAHVHFCARNIDDVKAFESEFETSDRVKGKALDINDPRGFSQWVESIGDVDVFIPNVSALSDSWEQASQIDLFATVSNIKMVIPHMTQGSAITYIGSISSCLPSKDSEGYGAIKAAMTHYVKSLALTHAGKIRFNIVAPSSTLTPRGQWDKFKNSNPERFTEKESKLPLHRLATPEEVANVVTFISSPLASYVVGETIHVNGGELIL
ncbi:SDR family NAD(P)-dependent oxidoreductase [Vibrio splendidus]|nr:SDR family oxidoreductase [Vibrio splendidus]AKN38410.1 Dehydrogenases with different specificities (related to short-chain alcohol dehydrogenases) [Vibrio splendidus]OEE57371.1 hypothetical protein A147_23000 [Vibrio splendidus FF-6]